MNKVTSFDFDNAFKALADIDVPVAGKVKANRLDLKENLSNRKQKLDSLMEDYYDIADNEELEAAKEAREAEINAAKLAKIEKIVDLDAETPEDIQPSYAGKYIVQCPQCMTLIYKDKEDIEVSEENGGELTTGATVNVGEACQQCGHEDGYTVIGKVGAVEEETPEIPEEVAEEEVTEEETTEVPEEETEEVATEDAEEELPELTLEPDEEAEAALENEGEEVEESLTEDLDSDMKEYNEYIQYLKNMLAQDEEALEKAKKMKDSELAIAVIEKRIAADKEDLEAALPKIVKDKSEDLPAASEIPEETEETATEDIEVKEEDKEEEVKESLTEAKTKKQYSTYQNILWDLFGGRVIDGVSKAGKPRKEFERGAYDEILNHRADPYGDWNIIVVAPTAEELDKAVEIAAKYGKEVVGPTEQKYATPREKFMVKIICSEADSEDGFNESLDEDLADQNSGEMDKMLNSAEFNKPISDNEVEKLLNDEVKAEAFDLSSLEEIDEAVLENQINHSLLNIYENVDNFKLTNCSLNDNSSLIVEGVITFKSGTRKNTSYIFNEATVLNDKVTLKGLNEGLSTENSFIVTGSVANNKLITETLNYKYVIGKDTLNGLVK